MIAQDSVRARNFPKERRIGPYHRLRKIPCADKRQARACEIHETCGLVAVYACIRRRELAPSGSELRSGLRTWHGMLGLSVFVLVWKWRRAGEAGRLHAAAALFHHFVLKDATLRRMLP